MTMAAETMALDHVRQQELRLGGLLRDIEALHAELEAIERRIGELDARRVDGEDPSARAAGAEALARRVAEAMVLRGLADAGSEPARDEPPVLASVAPARPQAVDVVDAARADVETPRVERVAHPASAVEVPNLEDRPIGVRAVAPARRGGWARPVEIAVHLAILLVLIALATGAFH